MVVGGKHCGVPAMADPLLTEDGKPSSHLSAEARAEEAGEGWQGQGACSDLHGLLLEIQALRQQLERSIETNHSLQSKLEEQLAQGSQMAQAGALTLAVQTVSMPEQPLQPDRPGMTAASPRPLCVCVWHVCF